MNSLEKVSVIVAVYNAENTLKRCLSSLVGQTYDNIEIIAVDDGSQDSSFAMLENFAKRHPKKIRLFRQPNSGVASARNRGLANMSGDYVAFVDSDDALELECFEKLIEKAREYDADITRFKIIYEYANGVSAVEKDIFPDEELFLGKDAFPKQIYSQMLRGIGMNAVWRNLYKRAVIDGLRFRKGMTTAEDLVFNISAFTNAKNFLYIPYPCYHYYQSGTGLTGRGLNVLEKYRCNFIANRALLKHLKEWDMLRPRYIAQAALRHVAITVSKLKRSVLKNG